MILSTIIMDSTVNTISTNAQISIKYYNSSDDTLSEEEYVYANLTKVNYSNATNLSFTYQPQKSNDYPDAEFWSILEVQMARSTSENVVKNFLTQLLVIYAPASYNYTYM